MKIRKYDEFINEEFIGDLLKGALKSMFGEIAKPFKEMLADIKNWSKEPSDLKQEILDVIKKSFDAFTKNIDKLENADKIDDAYTNLKDSISEQKKEINKQINNIFKDGSEGRKEIVNKLVDVIIKGLTDYKPTFDNEVKKGKDDKSKKGIAKTQMTKLYQTLEKNINKLSDDELEKIANENKDKVEYKVGDNVKYKKNDGTEGTDKIEKIEGDRFFFKDNDGKEFVKMKDEIIGISKEEDSENVKKAKETLAKIKTDDVKMGKVAKFADFISNDANKDKVAEIEKMMGA